ncbi:MAG TPA: caspase family protein [Bryobacteraceae bacterium]|nr:caspase family protein [Bryobacteraceae bacterium]
MPGWKNARIFAALAVTAALGAVLSVPAAAQGGKRLALVIGNDAYSSRPLKNAVNDARIMDTALQAAGFRTIVRENAKKADMEEAMIQFVEQLGPDDTALFFYAGHGVQIENENFLVPVDFVAGSTVTRAKMASFSMAQVIEYLKRARPKQTILILDACRSNPVAESQSLQAGLAIPLNAGSETFIAFSTSPNKVAMDNPNGRNSWYSEALADMIAEEGLTIDEVFTRVAKRVQEATGDKQTPWKQSSMTSKFYFRVPAGAVSENDPSVAEKWMDDARMREQHGDWPEAIDLINQVVGRKPGGLLEELAKSRLPYLSARRDARAAFDKGDFSAAAKLYSQAAALDPFSMDTAFQGVNCYLLSDQPDEALRLLRAIRMRGTGASMAKANAMLKELAAAYPEAGLELKAALPQPPPLEEVFGTYRFGVPDWDAGQKQLRASNADLTRWTAQVTAAYPPPPPPPPPATPADTSNPPTLTAEQLDAQHLEVITTSNSRDIIIRKVGTPQLNATNVTRPSGVPVKISTDPPGAELSIEDDPEQHCQSPCVMILAPTRQVVHARLDGFLAATRELRAGVSGAELKIPLDADFGFVQFEGLTEGTIVLVDGKQVARAGSSRVQLPVGKYDIRLVQQGKVLTHQEVEVKSMATATMTMRQQ